MLKLKGSIVALVTPFSGGDVDAKRLRELVDFHLQSGTDGIVPVGTTGESPTLSRDEKALVIKTVVKAAKGRVPVIAGTGTNDTRATVEYTKMAKELGADAALVVAPYYNKPTQEGLFRHYEAVAKVGLPVVLYNVPGRTAVTIAPETTARLAKVKNIIATKEAAGNVEFVTQIRALCDLAIVSGDDSLTLPMMALGATGVISVAANVAPGPVAEMCALANKGDGTRARELHERLFPLFKGLFLETSPAPVKAAMKLMGLGNGELRLPLVEVTAPTLEKVRGILKALELA
jgi:4-hydroxy-tetrahydrodipicolinate synthase